MLFITAIIVATVSLAHPNCMADVIESTAHLRKRSGVDFTYDDAADWGKKFTTCQVVPNNYQSPIDFRDGLITKPAHAIRWADSLKTATFQNTGHTLQVDIPASDGAAFTLDNQGLVFHMAQFHFHAPGEHTQYTQAYDLEVHFVHKSADGVLAVEGVWFKESVQKESTFLKSLLTRGVPTHTNDSIPVTAIDFTEIKQAIAGNSSWAYLGSLTTPPCTSNVRWTVSKAILPISKAQLEILTSTVHGMDDNNRPVTNNVTVTNNLADNAVASSGPVPAAGHSGKCKTGSRYRK